MFSVQWFAEGWGKAGCLAQFAVVCENLTQGECCTVKNNVHFTQGEVTVHCGDLSSKDHCGCSVKLLHKWGVTLPREQTC